MAPRVAREDQARLDRAAKTLRAIKIGERSADAVQAESRRAGSLRQGRPQTRSVVDEGPSAARRGASLEAHNRPPRCGTGRRGGSSGRRRRPREEKAADVRAGESFRRLLHEKELLEGEVRRVGVNGRDRARVAELTLRK